MAALQRHQIVATALPHPQLVLNTNLTLENMLGFADEGQAGLSIPFVEYKLTPMARKAKVLREIGDLDLQHVPGPYVIQLGT